MNPASASSIIRNLDKYTTPYFGILKRAIATNIGNLKISPEIELLNLPSTIVPLIAPETSEEEDSATENSDYVDVHLEDTNVSNIWFYPGIISKNPYVIMNSLTSEQIRRLISTSYNAFRNMDRIHRRFTPDLKRFAKPKIVQQPSKSSEESSSGSYQSNESATPSKRSRRRRAKQITAEQILARLLRPTQASMSRRAIEIYSLINDNNWM